MVIQIFCVDEHNKVMVIQIFCVDAIGVGPYTW